MGGGGKGGGKGGGGGSTSVVVPPNPYEQSMANIANELYSKTSPLRGYFLEDWAKFMRPSGSARFTGDLPYSGYTHIGNWQGQPIYYSGGDLFTKSIPPEYQPTGYSYFTDILKQLPFNTGSLAGNDAWSPFSGNPSQVNYLPGYGYSPGKPGSAPARYDPSDIPGYAPIYQLSREGIENQFSQARQGIIGSMPRGGGLNEALSNLEISRAVQTGSLPATISASLIQDIINKAYGAAWNAPQASLSGLGGAASSFNTAANANLAASLQQQQMANQQSSGLGMGLGSMAAMGLKAASGGKARRVPFA